MPWTLPEVVSTVEKSWLDAACAAALEAMAHPAPMAPRNERRLSISPPLTDRSVRSYTRVAGLLSTEFVVDSTPRDVVPSVHGRKADRAVGGERGRRGV